MLFKFYHADRQGMLSEGTELNLCERQLSPFGRVYWDDICKHKAEGAQLSPAAHREFLVEEIRKNEFPHAVSRFQCFFGANYLDESIRFARSILPVPQRSVPIFEVYASQFVTLDMNLIDVSPSDPEFIQHVRWYWKRVISNHGPPSGNRKAPNLEVLMCLPVVIGAIASEVSVESSIEKLKSTADA